MIYISIIILIILSLYISAFTKIKNRYKIVINAVLYFFVLFLLGRLE